jgi:hypothetical protein
MTLVGLIGKRYRKILPGGVIGNTAVFGTAISGSSPGRVSFLFFNWKLKVVGEVERSLESWKRIV